MKCLIKGGHIIDPANKRDEPLDIFIDNGILRDIGQGLDHEADIIVDAMGCWVTPGLIDMHVHLREPGYEHKETIQTGCESAAQGGFTTICAMPNTKPVTDNPFIVSYINQKAKDHGCVHVLPIGAITKEQKGEKLADIGAMVREGICAISEDGASVTDSSLMKKAMTYAKMFGLPILCHSEESSLAGSGVVHPGRKAAELGLKGLPADSEYIGVARDMLLGESTSAKTHICHVSTKRSVDLIRYGKATGINITSEVCPHHFTLCHEDIPGYDTNYKMNPPLRGEEDVEALRQGLKDGTIDVIATDHAPHHIDEKRCTFDDAAFGIIGLETAVPLTITELVKKKVITPYEMIEKMSTNPAKILGINKGNLTIGNMADITIINPNVEHEIDINGFASKATNSPFHGRKVIGKTVMTLVEGKIVYDDKKEEAK